MNNSNDKLDLCTATLAYWGRNNAVRKEQLPPLTISIYRSRVLTTLHSIKKLSKKNASEFNRYIIIRNNIYLN